MVPKVRFELTRSLPHRFLRPARLPFRHFGLDAYLPSLGLEVSVLQTIGKRCV